jgi:hypothetical protein
MLEVLFNLKLKETNLSNRILQICQMMKNKEREQKNQ